MLYQWVKVSLLAAVLHGLCPSVLANTTATTAPSFPSTAPSSGSSFPTLLAQTDLALPPPPVGGMASPPPTVAPSLPAPGAVLSGNTRIALLLPVRSSMLGRASTAVRSGFQAAYEQEPAGVTITLIGTDDTPEEIVSAYASASKENDIVVGPLSRSGVTAVARSGLITKPTIALNTPEVTDGGDVRLPPQMVPMGLSIEDEARQLAGWINRDRPAGKVYIVHAGAGWQRRTADAFAAQWQYYGRRQEVLEVEVTEGFLHGKALDVLRRRAQADSSAILFAALDVWQARQLRESVGRTLPLYGTSQFNPLTLSDRLFGSTVEGMDGAYLLDIPWQLQPDDPAVAAYQRPAEYGEEKRSADLERLYALGVDAYRVARAIAAGHTAFEMDGVTGKLTVRLGGSGPAFERVAQEAVYREGNVVPLDAP